MNVNDKREKTDKNFKDLHAKVVSKKEIKKAMPPKGKKAGKDKPNTKEVEDNLDQMQV